jgi:hypothetical protein
MEDVAKTLVQVSTALVLMIILVLVASTNMMHVRQVHAAMEPPALIMGLVTLVSVHMGILVSLLTHDASCTGSIIAMTTRSLNSLSDANVTIFHRLIYSRPPL